MSGSTNQQPAEQRLSDRDRFRGITAILRGLKPDEAAAVGDELHAAGIRILEVPLNSPEPYRSIEVLRSRLPDDCLVGAGTVLFAEDVARCADAGASFVVSPNTNPVVIRETTSRGLTSIPGAATPTEALTALHSGAHLIKVFPAVQVGLHGFSAWQAVLPHDLGFVAVGGIEVGAIHQWVRAGAVGVGLGHAIYQPGAEPEDIGLRAAQASQAWDRACR